MLAVVRSLAVARLSALLVACALSGALPLVEPPGQEAAPHRCQCHHGPGEVCLCARCHRGAAGPSQAELDALPPCHRAAAEAARARVERAGEQPMLTGCCSTPGPRQTSLAGAEPCLLPPPVQLLPRTPAGRVAAPPARTTGLLRAPPTPPPRVA